MNNDNEKNYPTTAVPTWSGFVYKGKIALYHCLKLINQGDSDFELQLDSSDNLEIYKKWDFNKRSSSKRQNWKIPQRVR